MAYIARTVRLSPLHDDLLRQLMEKLGIDANNVIRVALMRLASAEGVSNQGASPSHLKHSPHK